MKKKSPKSQPQSQPIPAFDNINDSSNDVNINNGKNIKVRKKSDKSLGGLVVVVGVLCLAGVAVLTYAAVTLFVNKINSNADADYQALYYRSLMASQVQASDDKPDEVIATTSDGRKILVTYVSDSLVQADDKWYIASDTIDNMTISGDSSITTDPSDFIMIDGRKFIHIEEPDIPELSELEPFGNEYVVVDINGDMVYLVKKGDTLSEVSGRVGYSVQELAKFNSIKNVNLIYSGQTLRVPASEESIAYVKAHQGNKSADKDDSPKEDNIDSETNNPVD